ncbi:MAG: hypothetical protein NTV08_15495 [Verrucomicrobia bacterium]|jgi:hypothetical protein|nr:hypothetical protein [Verrucomicrobiota bacterium]
MPAEARVMRTWIQQKGLIPVFLFGFAVWFLWDGLIGWPRSNKRFDAHALVKDKSGEWEKLCAARGWTTEAPHKRYGRSDINMQLAIAALTGVIGAFSLVFWLRAKKTFIRSEDDAVITPSGKRVPYASITDLDLRKWKSKGLAKIVYSLEGAKGRFILDDAKYDPTGLDAILEDIRQQTAGRAKVDE